MNKLRIALHGASAAALVLLIAASVAFQGFSPTSDGPGRKVSLKAGPRTYSIAQAAEVWPRMTEARIDPLDVHVGDRQTISVTVESQGPVDEVVAYIQTDTGTFELALPYVGPAAAGSSAEHDPFELVSFEEGVIPVARAEGETTKGKYEGSWIVRDTHDTTYQTRLVARAGGDESEVVMSWTDACGIPMGGSFTLSSPCTISSNDGIDNGSITISSSLTLDAHFAFNEGQGFVLGTGGSLALCSSCQLKQTNIWMTDGDGDGYPASFTMFLQDNDPPQGARRYTLNGTVDCDDTDPGANESCNEQFWPDADGDGYFSVNPVSSCPKEANCDARAGDDCYDGNANAYPGQTSFFSTERGDGSFDYNCDGVDELADQDDTGISTSGECRWTGVTGPPGFCIETNVPYYVSYTGVCGENADIVSDCSEDEQNNWPSGTCYISTSTYTNTCR